MRGYDPHILICSYLALDFLTALALEATSISGVAAWSCWYKKGGGLLLARSLQELVQGISLRCLLHDDMEDIWCFLLFSVLLQLMSSGPCSLFLVRQHPTGQAHIGCFAAVPCLQLAVA
jgi:hypothetical protein